MKTLFVVVGLVWVLAFWYPGIVAVPINASSEESAETDISTESPSNESIYLVKEVSYEVGLVDTADLANSSQVVVVKPEDRIETDDITLWTIKNESAPDNETIPGAILAETTAETTDTTAETTVSAATNAQENKETTQRMLTKEDGTPANITD